MIDKINRVIRWFSGSLIALVTVALFFLVIVLLTLTVALGYLWLPNNTAMAHKSLPVAYKGGITVGVRQPEKSNPPTPPPIIVRSRATSTTITLEPDEADWLDSIDNQQSIEREGSSEAPIPPDLGRVVPAPGITYYRTKRTIAGGEAIFNVLEIADVTDPRIKLKVSLPKGQVQANERVTDHMIRNGPNVVAAINGDFYDIGKTYGGVTINMQMQDGQLVRTNEGLRPAFGIGRDGTPLIGVPSTNGSLTIGNQSVPIYHINYGPGEDRALRRDWLVLWTPTFGPNTESWTDPAAVAVVVRGLGTPLPLKPNVSYTGTVEQLVEGAGNLAIPLDGVVLHGRGTMADFLRRNATIGSVLSFKVEMDEPWASATQIIGGCNRLLVDWVIVKAAETDCAKYERDPRLPRTAIAFEGKHLWLVTVDGRQPKYSVGANNDEFAQFLLDLGARHALNLDGGGSTTFAIRQDGKPLIVNRPSDGQERPIANALLVLVNGAELQAR
ncbi:MAG: phosphodiester glycosidase family protein [Chloroflexota bacterium]